MSALESQGQAATLDVDPEIKAFINSIAYSLQKIFGQQREHLFIDIQQLIYDTLFPRRNSLSLLKVLNHMSQPFAPPPSQLLCQMLLQVMEIKTNMVAIGFPLHKWMGRGVVLENILVLCISLNCRSSTGLLFVRFFSCLLHSS